MLRSSNNFCGFIFKCATVVGFESSSGEITLKLDTRQEDSSKRCLKSFKWDHKFKFLMNNNIKSWISLVNLVL